jgi:hypothetical protein
MTLSAMTLSRMTLSITTIFSIRYSTTQHLSIMSKMRLKHNETMYNDTPHDNT